MYHLFPSFFAWHMGQSNYMVFNQTFKDEAWHLKKKNSKEEHYGPSQPSPLIYPHWVVIHELSVSVAWLWFVINARLVTPLEPHWWCCLTLNLTACWGKAKLYYTNRQHLQLCPGPDLKVYFVFFRAPLVYTPRDATLKITTTKAAYVLLGPHQDWYFYLPSCFYLF